MSNKKNPLDGMLKIYNKMVDEADKKGFAEFYKDKKQKFKKRAEILNDPNNTLFLLEKPEEKIEIVK